MAHKMHGGGSNMDCFDSINNLEKAERIFHDCLDGKPNKNTLENAEHFIKSPQCKKRYTTVKAAREVHDYYCR